jgi:hypothetical protein
MTDDRSHFPDQGKRIAGRRSMTDIYLIPYHSFRPGPRVLTACSGQFAVVERAILAGEWPYDNGDDPSFYVARRHGGPLTWGVCRQDVRTAIRPGSVVVFVSYTKTGTVYRYRMSAVATVAEKLDRCEIFDNPRFSPHADKYLNLLIQTDFNGWKYDESDRHRSYRHPDWLWRIADHGRLSREQFCTRHQSVREAGGFTGGAIPMARNYVVFSSTPAETYVSPNPPEVATAERGEREVWVNRDLKHLTIDRAAQLHNANRRHLRSRGFGYSHPELRFEMEADEAADWRRSLIATLLAQTVAIDQSRQ